MLFQVLDNKKECYAIFCDDVLCHYPNGLDLTHTWAPTPHFLNRDIEYAQLWCHGKSLSVVCPDHIKLEWQRINKRAKAFLTSFCEAKINQGDICFYDLVPKKFLLDFYAVKNKITEWVFTNYEKPDNHNFLLDLTVFIDQLKRQELNLKIKNLDMASEKVRKSVNKIKKNNLHIEYDLWGTVTGRLSTTKDSFPILTLNKELRSAIVPKNDVFIELDYNSAELRVLFALLGSPQPTTDIHSWINKNVFDDKYDREGTKKKVFSWLYNPNAKNKKLNNYLQRDKILHKYYSGGTVRTPYNRVIKADDDKALNYLIQSTTSDLFLTNVLKINDILQNKKSFISFCVHDSLVIDMAQEDRFLISEIVKIFSETKFGDFRVNLNAGKNYGALKRIS